MLNEQFTTQIPDIYHYFLFNFNAFTTKKECTFVRFRKYNSGQLP